MRTEGYETVGGVRVGVGVGSDCYCMSNCRRPSGCVETATAVRNPSGTVAYGASASPRTENIHAAAPTLETGD